MIRMMHLYYLISVFLLFVFVTGDEYLLDFPLGTMRGKTRTTITGIKLFSFQGVPFAEPPVNQSRFQAAQPKKPWTDILDATEERSYCRQIKTDNIDGDEDCLFINIFSPKDPLLNASLPVMMFMYGGGFIIGDSSEVKVGPDHLMNYGVVFVTFNYRVGPFGFLSTGDDVIPGNAGLKDQLLAIKFVNQYIQYFGGDPSKVTLMGQSAGAASVHYHVLSPKSNGLFTAAICESGSSLSAWASQTNHTDIAYLLATIVNPDFAIYPASSSEILKYLISVPASVIDRAAHTIFKMEKPADNQMQQGFYFAPVIEHNHSDAFLSKSMYELLHKGEFNDVKVIIGMNSEESLFYVTDPNFKNTAYEIQNDNTILIPRGLNAKVSEREVIAKKIKDFYCPYLSFTDNWRSLIKYFSDQSFARSLIKAAELQSRWGDVYFYEFQFHSVLGGNTDEPVIGFSQDVRHGEEMSFIYRRNYDSYNTTDLSKFPEIDQLVQKRVIRMFTDFAKYLNPTPEPIDLLQNVTWPMVKPYDFQYLAIGPWLEVRRNPKENMFRFWEDIFFTHGVPPFTSY